MLEDKVFDPVRITVADMQTGSRVALKVIGVLSDTAPLMMAGIWTSQPTLSQVFADRVDPTTFLFKLASGIDARSTADKLETAFASNGMQADALSKLLSDAVSASTTFNLGSGGWCS